VVRWPLILAMALAGCGSSPFATALGDRSLNASSEAGGQTVSQPETGYSVDEIVERLSNSHPAEMQAQAAIEECRGKRLAGEFPGFVQSIQCSNPRIIAAYEAENYPYMDLVRQLTAARLANAEQLDQGKLTEAQVELALSELQSLLNSEAQRRDLAVYESQLQARQVQTLNNIETLQERQFRAQQFGIWVNAFRPAPAAPVPPVPVPRTLTCWHWSELWSTCN